MTEKFIIAVIGSPHGLKGFVKVRPFSGEIGHLLELKKATLNKDGSERELCVEEVIPAPPAVLMRFTGIDSPEKAKMLTGAQLIAGRQQAAPLGEGEFYIEDLKGQPVITESGEIIGRITDIIEGGGGELAEIQLADKTKEEKKLVPFRSQFFSEINPQKGRLVLQNLWILE